MKKVFLYLVSVFMLTSCVSQSDYDKVVKENEELNAKLEELQKELEVYQLSPSKLCANIDELLKNKDVQKLRDLQLLLSKYHPESAELKKVNQYYDQAKSQIAREEEAKKKKRMQAVNKLKKEYDDVSGITWYYNPYFTHYNNTNRTSIYIGSKETSVWLRLKMSYTGDNWIFFENAYLSYDENTRKIIFDKYDNKESDNSGGSVWEWIDVSVDEYLLAYLEEMIKGKSIKMRLDGKYTKTRNLSANEINGIKDVLLAYDVLKNEITNKLKRELTNK